MDSKMYEVRYGSESNFVLAEKFSELAEKRGYHPAALAIAFYNAATSKRSQRRSLCAQFRISLVYHATEFGFLDTMPRFRACLRTHRA